MKPKLLPLLQDCINDGLSLGYQRAFKHDDTATKEQICGAQFNAIFENIFERFDFEEFNNG